MASVRGEIYEKGVVTSTFTANSAFADKRTGILKLSGNVRVHSSVPPAEQNVTLTSSPKPSSGKRELRCDQLEWLFESEIQKGKLAKAVGNVTVVTEDGGIVGPVPELWSTPDLKVVGTPEAFKNR
jgi:hypothetical protein